MSSAPDGLARGHRPAMPAWSPLRAPPPAPPLPHDGETNLDNARLRAGGLDEEGQEQGHARAPRGRGRRHGDSRVGCR